MLWMVIVLQQKLLFNVYNLIFTKAIEIHTKTYWQRESNHDSHLGRETVRLKMITCTVKTIALQIQMKLLNLLFYLI